MHTLTARRWGVGLGLAAAALLFAAAMSAGSARAQEADWGGEIPTEGVALLTWNGGTVADLVASAQANGFVSVFATSEGEFVGYIVGAPDFVNAEFMALFTGEIAADTPFVVLVGEGGGPAPTPTGTPGAVQSFETTLGALNATVEGIDEASGTVTITMEDDNLTVTVEATGVAPSIAHAQHIHALAACPTADADANDDGVVDIAEGLPSYGEVLIPLDDAIEDLDSGNFPTADAQGNLSYTATASVAALEAAIGGELDLANRTVVVHGVGDTVTLPSGVVAATLPVACGTLDAAD